MADRYEYSEKHKSAVFRGAFVYLFDKPQEDDKTGRKVWSVTAIFDDAKAAKPVFQKAFDEATKKLWGDKAAAMVKNSKFRSPFKDGGEMTNREGELYAGFEEGQLVVKLSSSQGTPGVVDRSARPIVDATGKTLVDAEAGTYEVLDGNQIYPGAYYRGTFVCQAYDRSDGFGASFKIENLQKVKDGDRLGGGGRAKATDDFEPIEGVDDDEFMS